MRHWHFDVTELNDKLFEAFEVELVHLSPVEQSDVDVTQQTAYFGLSYELRHSVVFEHFA
jgi:hypothetical protein